MDFQEFLPVSDLVMFLRDSTSRLHLLSAFYSLVYYLDSLIYGDFTHLHSAYKGFYVRLPILS